MTIHEDRRYWDDQAAAGIEAARHAVWSEPDYGEGTAECIAAVVDGLGDVMRDPIMGEVIDIGCGIGRLLVPLAVLFPRTDFIGIDISRPMLDHASSLLGREKVTNVALICGDVREVMFMDDLAGFYSVVTFQHLAAEMQHRYISVLAQSLGSGGVGRFQWVSDADPGPRSNPVSEPVMTGWCESAGLTVSAIDTGLVRQGWSWLTVVKP